MPHSVHFILQLRKRKKTLRREKNTATKQGEKKTEPN